MPTFDQARRYQAVLIFRDQSTEPRVTPVAVANALKSQGSASNLRLKLRGPTAEQQLAIGPNGDAGAHQVLSWSGGAGLWKLTVAPSRVDITFDALGYADLDDRDQVPSVSDFVGRVAPGLALVATQLGEDVQRVGIVVDVSAAVADRKSGVCAVAQRYLSNEMQDQARAGEVTELTNRINRPERVQLSGVDALINRIEHAVADANGGLRWIWDTNTTPSSALSPEVIRAFYVKYAQNLDVDLTSLEAS